MNIENHASIRAVKRIYSELANVDFNLVPEPADLYKIAKGELRGDKDAAVDAFKDMAVAAGDAIANVITIIDGLVVIGGGLSGASELFLPYLVDEMNGNFKNDDGSEFRRLVQKVYNLEQEEDLNKFLIGSTKTITVLGSDKTMMYDPYPRIGVGISKIGTNKAISLGAYAYALNMLGE